MIIYYSHCSLDSKKNNNDFYRGEKYMKKIGANLKEHATEIMNYEKKDVLFLTKKGKIIQETKIQSNMQRKI